MPEPRSIRLVHASAADPTQPCETATCGHQALRYQLRDQQPELVMLGSPRPCQGCGEPALTATPRQTKKGTHPTCFHDGWKWGLADAAERKAIGRIMRMLSGSVVAEKPRDMSTGLRVWHSEIPCAVCGTHDDVVVFRGCREWQEPYAVYRCFAHPPIRGFPPQSWEVKA